MSAYETMYEIVKRIPEGRVATYGQVAILAGNANLARTVGNALHANPDNSTIPCHRVVTRKGEVAEYYAFGGPMYKESCLNQKVSLLKKTDRLILKNMVLKYKLISHCD